MGGRIRITQKDREEATTGAVRWKMTVMRIFLVLVGATGVEEINTPRREVRKLVNPAFGTWHEGLCNYNDTTRIQFNGVSFRLFQQDQEMKYLQAPSGREGWTQKGTYTYHFKLKVDAPSRRRNHVRNDPDICGQLHFAAHHVLLIILVAEEAPSINDLADSPILHNPIQIDQMAESRHIAWVADNLRLTVGSLCQPC